MDGLEIVRQKLIDRGLSKASANSKTVDAVICVLAENEGLVGDAFISSEIDKRVNSELEEERKNLSNERRKASIREKDADDLAKKLEKRIDALAFIDKQLQEERDEFSETINKLETQEARDRYRLYKIFTSTNLISIQSPQNNSVFIGAIGAILSGTQLPVNFDLSYDKVTERTETPDYNGRWRKIPPKPVMRKQ